MKIKFVTENFDSYTDYRRLIDLAKFERVAIEQIIDDGSVYICSPLTPLLTSYLAALRFANPSMSSKFIHWNLERPPLDPWHLRNLLFDEIWVHDAVFMGCGEPAHKLKLVRIGSDRRLATEDGLDNYEPHKKSFDFIHLCAPLGRRWHILHHLPGITAPNAWGDERNLNLRNSKFMLNVHQDERFYMEPLRFALAAAYRLPLLTEELYPGNLDSELATQLPYANLLNKAAVWIDSVWTNYTNEKLFEKYCVDETFEKNVRKALA